MDDLGFRIADYVDVPHIMWEGRLMRAATDEEVALWQHGLAAEGRIAELELLVAELEERVLPAEARPC